MTGYSIFEGTLADMTWPAVEEAGRTNTPLLVPVAVIEQHGPHLPLGTDTYGAYLLCREIQRALAESGQPAVIAPPYYFGLNPSTGMFPGSLSVKRDTMVRALSESLADYARWGFKRQFVVNHHGDPIHNDAIAEAIAAVRAEGAETVLVMGGFIGQIVEPVYKSAFGRQFPLPESALLRARESDKTKSARERLMRSQLNVHAEERETSLMMRWFPELVSKEVDVTRLEPVLPDPQQLTAAVQHGKWREVSPPGYIGDPSVATPENGELYALEAADMAAAIHDFVGHGKACNCEMEG
jgi:creatinine amidohydrolase